MLTSHRGTQTRETTVRPRGSQPKALQSSLYSSHPLIASKTKPQSPQETLQKHVISSSLLEPREQSGEGVGGGSLRSRDKNVFSLFCRNFGQPSGPAGWRRRSAPARRLGGGRPGKAGAAGVGRSAAPAAGGAALGRGGPAGAGGSPSAQGPHCGGCETGRPPLGCLRGGAAQLRPAGGGSPVPDLGRRHSAGRALPPPCRLLGSRTVHRAAALPPLSMLCGGRATRAPPGLARLHRAAGGAGAGRWRPQTAGWATRGRKEGGRRWGWGGEGTSCLRRVHRRQRRAPAAQTARGAGNAGRAPGGRGARARRRAGVALGSHNSPDGARVPEGLGAARRRPARGHGAAAGSVPLPPSLRPSALPLPRAAGDGGGVCGKPCVSAVTWAGRGLGDVRGLCVAMCVGFGAAPAQPRGAGERRRRRLAQVRPRLARGTRREARGARPPGRPTAAPGVMGS